LKLTRRLNAELSLVRPLFGVGVGLGFVLGLITLAQAYVLTGVVNAVFLQGASLPDVQGWLVGWLGLIALRSVVLYEQDLTLLKVSERVKTSLRQRLAAHLFTLAPQTLSEDLTGAWVATLTEGVEDLDAYYRQYLPQRLLALLIPLCFLGVVFGLDWLSGLVLLFTAPLLPLFMVLIGMWTGRLSQAQFHKMRYLSGHFLDVLQGLTTLKLFNRSASQVRTLYRLSDEFRVATLKVLRVAFLSSLALELLTSLSIAVIAVEIGFRLLYGRMLFTEAFFILVLAPDFYQPLRNFAASFHAASAGQAAAEKLYAWLDQPPLPAPSLPNPIPNPLFPICFERVSYTYPKRAQAALTDLHFTLEAGQKVAFVGASGAGKSTVAPLLLGFLQPSQGQILVAGQNLNTFLPALWREKIAWVSQTPYLFQGSLLDNLRFARPQADMDALTWSAEQAGLLTVIEKLPQGWQTPIGERGLRLSGGEAQRLAIARAFLKDAPLLIWDEATANLDPLTEADILQAMAKLLSRRTALIIAHRLHTIYNADLILVLEAGRLVQSGSHAELITQEGVYQRLVATYER